MMDFVYFLRKNEVILYDAGLLSRVSREFTFINHKPHIINNEHRYMKAQETATDSLLKRISGQWISWIKGTTI